MQIKTMHMFSFYLSQLYSVWYSEVSRHPDLLNDSYIIMHQEKKRTGSGFSKDG